MERHGCEQRVIELWSLADFGGVMRLGLGRVQGLVVDRRDCQVEPVSECAELPS